MSILPLVSVSGGKDSTATLTLAVERFGAQAIRACFADTGNEHEATYDYVRHLHQRLGVPIQWIRRDFTPEWARRTAYVRDVWPTKLLKPVKVGDPDEDGVYSTAVVYTEAEATLLIERVMAVLAAGPTGNPFLDLCIIKGRFPSRKAQFCTQFLKTEPLTEYALDLIEAHGAVESWQGVRAEESASRAKLPEREDQGGGLSVYRPILSWNVAQVFAQHSKHGLDPNPLYLQGMNRVGCMPCINAAKDELLAISKRFPEHIDRIEAWEEVVQSASKRGTGTFFAGANLLAGASNKEAKAAGAIRKMVEWSQTKRGGKEADWIRITEEPKACASAYGLCE